jgi:hypothetical protein
LYGKPGRLKLQFASGATAGLDDGSGHLDMSLTQWDKNPFRGGEKLIAPQLTIRTKVQSNQKSRNIDNYHSSSVVAYSYYVSFNFDSKQNYSSQTNTTFPACTLYNTSTKSFVVGCPGCSVVSYSELNVTYGCDDVSRLLATNHQQQQQQHRYLLSNNSGKSKQITTSTSTDAASTASNGDDGYVADDDASNAADDEDGGGGGGDNYISGKQTSITSINYGALLSTFTSTLSGNPFAINFQESKIIIFLVSSIFITIVIGWMYYSRVDMMNRQKCIYIQVKEKKNDLNDKNNKKGYKNDDVKKVKDCDFIFYKTISNDDELKDDFVWSDKNSRIEYINKIVEKGFIKKVFGLDGFLSDKSFSLFEKKTEDEDEDGDNEEVDVTPQLNGWISFWIQILASIFVDTLFFSTFFPDDGVCETYTTQENCIKPKNNALNKPLCIWTAQKRITNGGTCSLSPPPADVTFTFILVVLTIIVTIPIVMFLNRILYYAFQRPQLSMWGWNEEYWLGKIMFFIFHVS